MFPEGQSGELRDYLLLIRRRQWIIYLAVGVTAVSALVGSMLQPRIYEASARMLVQPTAQESLFNPNTGRGDAERQVQTEIEVLKSAPIRRVVAERLGGTAPEVSAQTIGRTDVVLVNARSTNPTRAAEAANLYAKTYIDFRRRQAVDGLLAAGQDIQVKITQLNREISDLEAQARGSDAITAADLRARRDSLLQQQAIFRQRLDQVDVETTLKSGGAQLVAAAEVPREPVSPRPLRSLVLALTVGAFLGGGLALLWDYLDDTLHSRSDVEQATPDVPILGLIPYVDTWRERKTPYVVSIAEPHSNPAEAYRSLRTAVHFMTIDKPIRTMQVTSATAGEGKTSLVANLGITLARAGLRVVLVCCDLRRPRLMTFFGIDNRIGLTSVLLGEARLQDAVQPVGGEERLYVLPAGPRPPNPSEMLSRERTFEVFEALKEQSDIVLIDSAPVLPVTDAAVLGARVDATILLAGIGISTKRGLARAYELLRQVDANIIGTVLNGASQEDRYGYGYGPRYGYRYGYRYAADDDDGRSQQVS